MHFGERNLFNSILVLTAITLASCSFAPDAAFTDRLSARWHETEQFLAQGDIDGSLQQVEVLLAEDPQRAKAAAWKALLLAGKARGFFELAEAYESGARENHAQVSAFQRASSTYRSRSRAASLALAEVATAAGEYFDRVDTIQLDFPVPPGSISPSPIVRSLEMGRWSPDSQLAAAEDYTIRRAVVLTVCESSRGARDLETAAEIGTHVPAISRPRLLATVGKVLYQQADLFAKTRLNDPGKRELLLDLSKELLETSLLYQERQKASLQLWESELQNRRSLP